MYIQIGNRLPKFTSNKAFKLHGNEEQYLIETENELLKQEMGPSDRLYVIIDHSGNVGEQAFVVFNNIPVTKEGMRLFEDRFQNRARKIEDVPGFQAIRVCRPLNSDTYVVITFWEDELSFESWRNSEAYKYAHKKRGSAKGIDKQRPEIFPRPSYVETYYINKINDKTM